MPGINHCLNNRNKITLVKKYCAIVILCIKLNTIWEVQPSQQQPVNDPRTQSRCCVPFLISKLHLRQETRSMPEPRVLQEVGVFNCCKRPRVLLQSSGVTNCFIASFKPAANNKNLKNPPTTWYFFISMYASNGLFDRSRMGVYGHFSTTSLISVTHLPPPKL